MAYRNMKRRIMSSKILVRNLIFLLLFHPLIDISDSFGYDSASTACSPNTKQSRRGRSQMLAAIPCDLTNQAYCTLPGAAYPWHAVRRFVHENQGLMKRMYGDVRHISVLRDEILNNEIDIDDIELATDRYSRDGYNRRASKFMHNRDEFDNFKGNDVLKEPYFRPVTTKTTTITTTTTATKPTASSETKTDVTTDNDNVESTAGANEGEGITTTTTFTATNSTTTTTTQEGTDAKANVTTDANVNDSPSETSSSMLQTPPCDEEENTATVDDEEVADIVNIELNSVYETPKDTSPPSEMLGDNIEIIESPQLGLVNTTNNSETTTTTQAAENPNSTTTPATTTAQGSTPSTLSTRTTTTTTKPETVAERSPVKQQRKPFVPSSTKQQRPQQLHKVDSTISAKLKLKMNPTPATPLRTTTSSNNTSSNAASSSSTLTTPLTSTKTSPFKGQLNKNYNRYTTLHNNRYGLATTAPPGSSVTPSAQPLKSNADILLGEKIRKTGANVTPASAPAVNKPVLRDGQLFQDTMKKEQVAPVVNARGVNACPIKEEVVAPFWANNTRGEVLALLNLYPFEQYVHWEKCTHEHKQMYCREGCRCEQQYRLHRLLAYDPHNECRGIFSDWFRFPSCCICKCYNIPLDFRATSRSPRSESGTEDYRHPIEVAEEQVKNAIYEHATEDWYRPKDEFDFFEG